MGLAICNQEKYSTTLKNTEQSCKGVGSKETSITHIWANNAGTAHPKNKFLVLTKIELCHKCTGFHTFSTIKYMGYMQ